MKNPYVLPLRLRRQRLAELRQEIAAAQAQLASLQVRDHALIAQAVTERRLRQSSADVVADAWFSWQNSTRAALAVAMIRVTETLDATRAELRDELGQLSALEQAEAALLAAERRRRERREQAAADDCAATLFLTTSAA